jgi:hypothetical protein
VGGKGERDIPSAKLVEPSASSPVPIFSSPRLSTMVFMSVAGERTRGVVAALLEKLAGKAGRVTRRGEECVEDASREVMMASLESSRMWCRRVEA